MHALHRAEEQKRMLVPDDTMAAAEARTRARKLFEAKQPASRRNRSFVIALGLGGLIASGGIGGYVWWQLQPKGGLVAGSAAPTSAPALPRTVPPEPTFVAPSVNIPPQAALAPPVKEQAQEPPPARRVAPRPAAVMPAARSESPIHLSAAVQQADPLLEQGWQAFNQGQLELAHTAWQKALARDPRNAHALHGLAAIAQQRQLPHEAAEYYLRALEADPKDARALAALTTLRASADALQTASRLKALLAEQPDSPYLNFALGNLHARDGHWAEAQQAYFRAHTADAANPDYLFNLAVSLDQLRQPRLAIQYYQRALAAAERLPAGFDPQQLAARLKALQASE